MIIFFSTLALTGTAHADSRPGDDSVVDDAEALIRAPFEAEGGGLLRTAVAGAVIGATLAWVDAPVDRWISERPGSIELRALHSFAGLTNWYGKSGRRAFFTSLGLIGATAIAGNAVDNERMVDTAGIMAESLAFSTVIAGVGKVVLGRKRPNQDRGPHAFDWFVSPFRQEAVSFPSGHAATAFSMAGAAAGRHPHWYVRVPAYVMATSASLQRMDARAHWTSDVLAGALLGYAVAEFLVDRNEDEESLSNGTPQLSVSFVVRF